jgi:hypothetical protein
VIDLGWFKQPARHALAAKGISTGRFQAAQLRSVQHGNEVRGSFGRASGYVGMVKRLGRRHDEGDEIDSAEYEKAVTPLFDSLAEADVLCDRCDLREAVSRLDLAGRQYEALCERFNVIREEDSREFLAATKQISEKTIVRSRTPPMGKVVARSQPPAVSQTYVDDKSRGDERDSR